MSGSSHFNPSLLSLWEIRLVICMAAKAIIQLWFIHSDNCKQNSAPEIQWFIMILCSFFFTSCFKPFCFPAFSARPSFPSHFPLISLSACICFFHPQSDIYFVSSAPVSSASNCSSRDTSSQSSPQTPTGYEMPMFPSPLGDGKTHAGCLTLESLLAPSAATFVYVSLGW